MKKVFLYLSLLVSFSLSAGEPVIDNLSRSEFEELAKEYGANFKHNAVSPASTLGDVFGFEVGLILGATKTPTLEALVKEEEPNNDVEALPHAGIYLAASVPLGFTGELSFVPERTDADVTFKFASFAVKWTFSDLLIGKGSVVDMAFRLHAASSELTFSQEIQNTSTSNQVVSGTTKFDTKTWGSHFLFSSKFLVFEPYIGFGFLSSSVDLTLTATNGTFFEFTTAQSASESVGGGHFFLGLQLDLWFLHLAVESSKALGKSSVTGKASFSLGF